MSYALWFSFGLWVGLVIGLWGPARRQIEMRRELAQAEEELHRVARELDLLVAATPPAQIKPRAKRPLILLNERTISVD